MSVDCGLVTFGEAMVRLSPPHFRRLEQAATLDVNVGGAELNVAVTAARLGAKARFVTRLTRNPLGRMVENKAREQGVDTSGIVWTDDDRVGVYFVEFGASPRANAVIYDRRGSAMAQLHPEEFRWDEVLRGAQAFHTSGITAALSPSAAEATEQAVRAARSADVTVSVDLNYRARLWSQDQARVVMTRIVEQTDILITTEEDTERVFGIRADSYEEAARKLAERFELKVVAITLRETPSVWCNTWSAIAYERSTGQVHQGPKFDVELVDRVGAGDAFAGGFLYGYFSGGVRRGLDIGVAVSALKQTVPGDLSWATLDEVERLLGGAGLRIDR
jgi:2-dehydro-3-deoxygluconokinase